MSLGETSRSLRIAYANPDCRRLSIGMSPITLEVAFILLLTVVNGLFAMSEVALLSARKVRLQQLADRGNARAGAALTLLQDPNNFLSTVQIGVTLVRALLAARQLQKRLLVISTTTRFWLP